MRDGDVGDDSNNFSLHVRCTYTSHGRPDDRSGRGHAPRSFSVSLSAMLIVDDGYTCRSRGHSRPTFSSDEIVRVNDDPLLSHSCNPSIRKVDKATRKLFPALHTSFRRRTALRTIARIPGLQTSLFHSRPRLSKCVTNRSVHTANSFTPYQDHSQPPPDPPWP